MKKILMSSIVFGALLFSLSFGKGAEAAPQTNNEATISTNYSDLIMLQYYGFGSWEAPNPIHTYDESTKKITFTDYIGHDHPGANTYKKNVFYGVTKSGDQVVLDQNSVSQGDSYDTISYSYNVSNPDMFTKFYIDVQYRGYWQDYTAFAEFTK